MKKHLNQDGAPVKKFGIRDSLAYAAGDLGCNMSFALKGTMALFWTQFMGLGLWYSALLVVVQVWDAINDPLIGSIIDADQRAYKRRNKFLQYIWFGSIGLIVGGALCFIPIPSAPDWAKIIIFIAGYVIWDAFYTIANVPYGSLLSIISDKPADRASLSAWRSIGSMVGNMVPMIILPFIIYDKNDNLIGENVFIAALIMGVLGFLCFQFMIRNTTIRVSTDLKVSEEKEKFNVLVAMKNFMKNRPAVGATLAAMGMFIGMQGAATCISVTFQAYFHDAQISGLISMFAMIPIVVFTPLARKMVVKFGKKELSAIGAICYIVGALGLFIINPANKGLDLTFYVVSQLICSLGMGIYSTVSWAMMGDAIDYNEWKTGKREEGVVYSLHSFFRKLAQGVGPAVALAIMAGLGYVNNAILNPNPVMEDGSDKYLACPVAEECDAINVNWLGDDVALKLRTLIPCLYLVAGIFQFVGLALIYNLDKKTLARMNEELAARHSEETPATTE